MVNRIRHLVDEPRESAAYDEFYEIEGVCDTYIVPYYTALAIERQLDRVPHPMWVEFRDLFGARHRIPGHHVLRISESTPAIREAARAFERARKQERKGDSDPFCEQD